MSNEPNRVQEVFLAIVELAGRSARNAVGPIVWLGRRSAPGSSRHCLKQMINPIASSGTWPMSWARRWTGARSAARYGRIGCVRNSASRLAKGGMGVVYLAEQQRPYSGKVASKIIKPGMDTMHVVARFRARNGRHWRCWTTRISPRCFDAGTTESGPTVFRDGAGRGIPITEYCDDRKLTIDQRLNSSPSLRRSPSRSSKRDHPPRYQAIERLGHRTRKSMFPRLSISGSPKP